MVAFGNDIEPEDINMATTESVRIDDPGYIVSKVALERIEPIREGDEYGWMLTSEPGQLAYSLNALDLDYLDPEVFADETTILYSQDGIDLERIIKKFNLNDSVQLSDNITITYTQDDIRTTNLKTITSFENEDTLISPMATGSFSQTLRSNGNYETSSQKKDDNEQKAYITLTDLAPTNYSSFSGVYIRVNHNDGYSMTSLVSYTRTGSYTLSYRSTMDAEAGDRFCLELNNTNDRALDVAGRWTP